MRAAATIRTGLHGKAREWNRHNVMGIWCAVPLLIISLTGIVMSFDWANALLFRLADSTPAAGSRRGGEGPPRGSESEAIIDPDYESLMKSAKKLNVDWRVITINLARDSKSPITVSVDTGSSGQPQKRIQYFLNRDTGTVVRSVAFADGSLGQRLRAFVRFGHTGEYGGALGQVIAATASVGACVLIWTGLALTVRRIAALFRRRQNAEAGKLELAPPVAERFNERIAGG